MLARVASVAIPASTARAARAVEDRGHPAAVALVSALSVRELARVRQVHGTRTVTAAPGEAATGAVRTLGEGDALIATQPDIGIAVLTADCVPVLLADLEGRAVAAVHVGWRGAAAGVLAEVLGRLLRGPEVPPSSLAVEMGPAAGGCCYEVGPEVVEALREAAGTDEGWLLPGKRERPNVDLRGFVRTSLLAAGVPAAQIVTDRACTICGKGWPSYRRQGRAAGRIWSAIALRPR